MAGATDEHLPWNEGSALEELERIKQAIDECRRRRKELQAEFDGFVRSFRTPVQGRAITEPSNTSVSAGAPGPQRPPHAAPDPVALRSMDSVSAVVLAPADPQPEPVTASTGSSVAELPVPESPRPVLKAILGDWRTRRTGLLAVAATVGLVVIAGFLMARSGSGPSPATPSSGVNRSAGPARQAAQPIAVPSPPPAAAANAGPPRSEILAERRVWVRVVVDGVKTAERELDPGERVALPEGATAAIRAGNAGAVRITVNGQDRGLLGAEGEVLTRTVRIPAASR